MLPMLNVLKKKMPLHRLLAFKKRHIYTRTNKIRARYAVSGFCVACFALAFSLQNSPFSSDLSSANSVSSNAAQDVALVEPSSGAAEFAAYSRVLPNNLIDLVRRNEAAAEKPDDGVREFVIESGQTVAGILQNVGVSGADSHKIVEALSEHIDLRKVKAGQSFKAKFDKVNVVESAPALDGNTGDDAADLHAVKSEEQSNKAETLAEITMTIDPIKSVSVQKSGDEYKAEIKEKEVLKRTYAGTAEIQTSLYGSAARSGIPSQIIGKMIRMYSFSVDFQRDIRRDDKIELLYDVYETEDGEAVRYGEILYANLSVSGRDIPLYRFENSQGNVGYYDEKGQNTKKTLMKTPVDGARMSSGFGMRKHPILGYNKMHKGVDFAAPIGTPIYAAGDGKLEKVGRNGAYGNYILIRHTSGLKTAYAHMHKFGKGIRAGGRVQQGDVIGYVGSTGRSTGPHLHFEVLLNGKQVNPNRVDLPIGEPLGTKDLDKFKAMIKKYNEQYVELLKSMKFASSEQEKSGTSRKVAG